MIKIEREFKFLCIIPQAIYHILLDSNTKKYVEQTYFENEKMSYRLRHVRKSSIKFADENPNAYYLTVKSFIKHDFGEGLGNETTIVSTENEVELSEKEYHDTLKEFRADSSYKEYSISKTRFAFANDLVVVDIFASLPNGDKIGIIEIEHNSVENFNFRPFLFITNVSSCKEFKNLQMAKQGSFPLDIAINLFLNKMECPFCAKWNMTAVNEFTIGCPAGCFETSHTYLKHAFTEVLDFYKLFN